MSARPETTRILLPDTQVVTQGNGKQVPCSMATSMASRTRSEEAAGDREGIGTAHVAEIVYLHTQKHLHGSGIVSAGPTCMSSPVSVWRACSHACGIGDMRSRARASRFPRR